MPLQWGRNFCVAEIITSTVFISISPTLQWGRNFCVAEIRHHACGGKKFRQASMGPQLLCCGNHGKHHYHYNCRPNLQWGRNFCVAEIEGRHKPNYFPRLSFNGAATFVLRKYGPSNPCRVHDRSFNGAATFVLRKLLYFEIYATCVRYLQWGRNFCVAEIHCQELYYFQISYLQWGRNFCVAEIPPSPHSRHQICTPSMGPQLLCCGNSTRSKAGLKDRATFNGAATFVLRKFKIEISSHEARAFLQWGRNFCVAEIMIILWFFFACLGPSMGPQLLCCGNTQIKQ